MLLLSRAVARTVGEDVGPDVPVVGFGAERPASVIWLMKRLFAEGLMSCD